MSAPVKAGKRRAAPSARQLALDLPTRPCFGREDFLVSPSNEQAWTMIEAWPQWPGVLTVLCGPAGAGKSHLGAIWADRARASVARAADLRLDRLEALAAGNAVLLEDAGPGALAERELFHLINLLKGQAGAILITAREPPGAWGVTIADLLSRLRLAPVVSIAEPDDALVRAVLVKLFLDRQLTVDTSVIEFLALRIERSLGAAREIVDRLDREALSRGRAVTRPMAAEVLRQIEATGGD